MAVIRFKALEKVFDRKPIHVPPPSDKTSDYFAINVFDKIKMQKYLSGNQLSTLLFQENLKEKLFILLVEVHH